MSCGRRENREPRASQLAPEGMATDFKTCWAEYATRRRLPHDPLAAMPAMTVAQARRDALEFFSQGLVHLRASDEAFAQLCGEGRGHDCRMSESRG